jgi:hypothetical protein
MKINLGYLTSCIDVRNVDLNHSGITDAPSA